MEKSETFIKTFIRIRPPATQSIYKQPNDDRVLNCCDKTYKFTHVFSPDSTDDEIFDKIGCSLIDNTLNGFNSTLFAYGQTGTGKTYTMTGNNTKDGLVQKSVNLLIRKLRNDKIFQYYSLRMNYIEIYNQTIRDLLSQKEGKIIIRQISKSGFYLQGLETLQITDEESFSRQLKKGLLKRSTKTTKMNEVSSRSHTIMTVFLQSKKEDDEKGLLVRVSKLNFVDLAGSQKQKQTEVSGSELKQASSINKSLTTLSLVISKLCEKQTKNSHIPYRESILTKILKDSIGGNSLTTFIGTISSQKTWISQTISTLLFLDRLKNVKNVVQINQKIQGRQQELVKKIKSLQQKVQQMEQEIQCLTQRNCESQQKIDHSQVQIKQLENRLVYQQFHTFFQKTQESDEEIQTQSQESQLPNLQVNHTQGLTIIEEISERSSSPSRKVKENVCYNSQVKKTAKKLKQDDNMSLQNSCKKGGKNFWQLQNQFLRKQIEKHNEQDQTYKKFIQLISENIDNLQFQEAKLLILQSQAQRLKNTQNHLSDYRYKLEQFLIFSQIEQAQIKSKLFEVRSLELDNISRKSIYLSNENKLRQQIEALTLKHREITQYNYLIENDFKAKLLKQEQLNLNLIENNQSLENEARLLRQQNQKLYQIISLHKKQSKVVDTHNYSKNEKFNKDNKEDKQNREKNDKLQQQNRLLQEKIDELQQMIENDLMTSIEQMQKQLKQTNQINTSLNQSEAQLKKIIKELQSKIIDLQRELVKQVQNRSTSIGGMDPQQIKFQLQNGQQFTFFQIYKKYRDLVAQSQIDKDCIQALEKEVLHKIQQLNMERTRLQNQKQVSKQSQTYLKYELKVKNLQISKLKYQKNRLITESNEKLNKDSQKIDEVQHLKAQIRQCNKQISRLEDVKVMNVELERKNNELNSRLAELLEQNREVKNQMENFPNEVSKLTQIIQQLKSEKMILQQKCNKQNSNFQNCLKQLSKVNQRYRTQQCYFYRFKLQLQHTVQMLKKQNKQLMKRLTN